jgi:hypothetical protein
MSDRIFFISATLYWTIILFPCIGLMMTKEILVLIVLNSVESIYKSPIQKDNLVATAWKD